MKLRGILLFTTLLFLAKGETYASHIAGAEITYKHLYGNAYQFKLKVYRDCKECKFNNSGGGDNTTNCNEVPPLIIKGALGTSYSTSQLGTIDINRKSITDLTLACNSAKSKCRPGSTIPYGYEEHVFEGVYDFGQLINEGYCKFDVSISLSSRSTNVNTSMSEQNFFNYAMINFCEGIGNESVEFESKPQFTHLINQSNFGSLNAVNPDQDSLAFHLKPALVNRSMSLTYALGRNSDQPFAVYCSGMSPCQANINGPLVEGFYCNKTNGDFAFTPTQLNQGGVLVIECEEWKKNANGNYYLAGVSRRDVYGDIVAENNNLPQIKNKLLDFALCEKEILDIEVKTEDLPWLSQANDTVFAELSNPLKGVVLHQLPINSAPYYKYILSVDAKILAPGKYQVTVNARDNHCSLNGKTAKTFNIQVLKSRQVDIRTNVKNCGNLEVIANNFSNKNIYWTVYDKNSNVIKQQYSRKINMQLPEGGSYVIKSYLPIENGFCELNQFDTIQVVDFKKPELDLGNDRKVCKGKLISFEPIQLKTFDAYQLYVNGIAQAAFPYVITAKQDQTLVFKVEQSNGCSVEDRIEVTVYPDLNYKRSNDTICVNDVFPKPLRNILVDATKVNLIDYTFSSNASNIERVNAINWNVDVIKPEAHLMTLYSIIQDKNNCVYFDTSSIQFIEPEPITVKCPEQICINASPVSLQTKNNGNWECINYPQFIKNNVLIVNGEAFNTLLLRYTEKLKCTDTKTFYIQPLDTTAISFGHEEQLVLCENSGQFQLKGKPEGGSWTGEYVENNTFNPSLAGGKSTRLEYTYTNISNCKSVSDIQVTVENLPSLKVSSNKTAVCVGDLLQLQALSSINQSGYWYTDGEGSFHEPVSMNTTYQPSLNDINKAYITFTYTLQTNGVCGNVGSSVNVKIKTGPSGDILQNYPLSICEPAVLKFSTNYKRLEKQYWFINDSLAEEFDYNFGFKTVLPAGEYFIKTKVYDSTCEALAISNKIIVLPVPKMKMVSNPNFKISREYPRIYLKDQSYVKSGHTVNWFFNDAFIGDSRELYYRADDSKDSFHIKLVATSDKGCKDSISQLFVFIPINQLYIPDAFSPDSKGPDKNNVFKVEGPAMAYFEMEIFNKYGEKVFMTLNMNEAWDGTYKSEMCMTGAYFYKIITTDYEGVSRDYSGTITLIR